MLYNHENNNLQVLAVVMMTEF